MKFFVIITLGVGLPLAALADNAVPIAHGTLDGYAVTVFGHPAPLRAGPVRLEWLIQDANGNPISPADWTAVLHAPDGDGENWVPPCCRVGGTATGDGNALGHSLRGFFHSARVVLGQSGSWTFELAAPTAPTLALEIAVASPPPPWFQFWPWFAAPLVVLAAFSVNLNRKAKP